MIKKANNHSATLTLEADNRLLCAGVWTRQSIAALSQKIDSLGKVTAKALTIQGESVSVLDSAGAWLLLKLKDKLKAQGIEAQFSGFNPQQESLLELVDTHHNPKVEEAPQPLSFFTRVGMSTLDAFAQMQLFFAFVGEIFIHGLQWLFNPLHIRLRSVCAGIQATGYQAITIIALLSFLIGMVLAYQVGVQLQNYGANVYVVDFLGLAILREFAPLITAIIIAGRTGSAFAAQIGTMKLNEEVDAIQTMGLSPVDMLVMPKVMALLIALPLLVVLSEIFGVMGGMFMSKIMLGIPYVDFLARFEKVIEIKTYFLGMIKTPFFALLIATIGCYQGFQVRDSAESVGQHTTIAVVQAIFMIIVTDAAFSILYSWLGI